MIGGQEDFVAEAEGYGNQGEVSGVYPVSLQGRFRHNWSEWGDYLASVLVARGKAGMFAFPHALCTLHAEMGQELTQSGVELTLHWICISSIFFADSK